MIQVNVGDYIVHVGESMPPRDDPDCAHAALVERFDSEQGTGGGFHGWHDLHVEVRCRSAWPFLCVAQHYHRQGGWYPGVLLVPETALLFIGAGERLLAYDVRDVRGPTRLWEDQADTGFHGWQRHEDLVVLSAELELAAWDLGGVKRWSAFVEPPWDYRVESGTVYLDVMGTVSSFPLWGGPSHA